MKKQNWVYLLVSIFFVAIISSTFVSGIRSEVYQRNLASVTDVGDVFLPEGARVWYVKNDAPAGGRGTITSPINSLELAQNYSYAGDAIFLFKGDGTVKNQDMGVVLKNGQFLIGEGVNLYVGQLRVIVGGRYPSITNMNGPAVQLADDSEVHGITIKEGSSHGIVGEKVSNVVVADNRIEKVVNDSVLLASRGDGFLVVRDNVIENGRGTGVTISLKDNSSAMITIEQNEVSKMMDHGLNILLADKGNANVRLADNNLDQNLGSSINVECRGLSQAEIEIVGNDVRDDIGRGRPVISLSSSNRSVLKAGIDENILSLGVATDKVNFLSVSKDESFLCLQLSNNLIDGGVSLVNMVASSLARKVQNFVIYSNENKNVRGSDIVVTQKGYISSVNTPICLSDPVFTNVDLELPEAELAPEDIIQGFSVGRCHPNPFEQKTSIPIVMGNEDKTLVIEVYDSNGKLVKQDRAFFVGGKEYSYQLEMDTEYPAGNYTYHVIDADGSWSYQYPFVIRRSEHVE